MGHDDKEEEGWIKSTTEAVKNAGNYVGECASDAVAKIREVASDTAAKFTSNEEEKSESERKK